MFENDTSVDAEIAMSKEALSKVESEAEDIGKVESKEWAKFASVAHKIDHALPESHWNTLHYAKVSKHNGEEYKEDVYATIVLETDRFQVVYHLGDDECLVLLKRDVLIQGRLFKKALLKSPPWVVKILYKLGQVSKKVLPRLPLLVAKVSYDWSRENAGFGAYVSFVNYDYNSDYQELYQLLQRELAERLKQKTYDTQVTTEFKKLASFS